MQQTLSYSIVLTSIAAACSLVPATGETYSNGVLDVRLEVTAAGTRPIAFPVSEAFTGATSFVSDALTSAVDTGDLIHLWLGKHFVTYEFSGQTGSWHILESVFRMPDDRLQHVLSDGYMLTRKATGTARLNYTGTAPQESSVTVSIAARDWRLIGAPFPGALDAEVLVNAGAQPGDKVKAWDHAESAWKTCTLTENGWEMDGIPDELTIGLAEAFLYYNGSSDTRTLTFTRPYAAQTRP